MQKKSTKTAKRASRKRRDSVSIPSDKSIICKIAVSIPLIVHCRLVYALYSLEHVTLPHARPGKLQLRRQITWPCVYIPKYRALIFPVHQAHKRDLPNSRLSTSSEISGPTVEESGRSKMVVASVRSTKVLSSPSTNKQHTSQWLLTQRS